jgi:imidazolonepropionase-like amidohydrolase
MEHAEFLEPDGEMRYDPAIADKMRDAGMYVSPTLQAAGYPTVLELCARREAVGLTADEEAQLATVERRVNTRVEHFSRMLDAGLLERMVAGSDSGCGNLAFGHLEYDLQLMARGGMTAMQVLVSATRVTAEAIGFGDLIGTLEPGKLADLIVVEGDPSEDVTALSRVRAVFQEGVQVSGPPATVAS